MARANTETQWMAHRTLTWRDREVVIQIGIPYEDSDLGGWKCACRVSHEGGHQISLMPGDDSMGAVTHALVNARKMIDDNFPGASWAGIPHSGLAMWIPTIFVGTPHQEALELLMWEEIERRMNEDIARRTESE